MSNPSTTTMFFPTAIRISQIQNHARLDKQLMSGVANVMNTEPNSLPPGWSCSLYTTICNPLTLLQHKEFTPLIDIIMEEASAFANALEFSTEDHPLKLTECWLNVYDYENAQEVHIHPNHVISGIYYPQAPEDCGELLIHSPYGENMFEPPVNKRNQLNAVAKEIKPEPGMMVLFRSFVKHSVKPNKSAEQRVSVAFNLTM